MTTINFCEKSKAYSLFPTTCREEERLLHPQNNKKAFLITHRKTYEHSFGGTWDNFILCKFLAIAAVFSRRSLLKNNSFVEEMMQDVISIFKLSYFD